MHSSAPNTIARRNTGRSSRPERGLQEPHSGAALPNTPSKRPLPEETQRRGFPQRLRCNTSPSEETTPRQTSPARRQRALTASRGRKGSPDGAIEFPSSGFGAAYRARAPLFLCRRRAVPVSQCGFCPKAKTSLQTRRREPFAPRLGSACEDGRGGDTLQPTAGAGPRVPGPYWHF